jgi:hypothetical protein
MKLSIKSTLPGHSISDFVHSFWMLENKTGKTFHQRCCPMEWLTRNTGCYVLTFESDKICQDESPKPAFKIANYTIVIFPAVKIFCWKLAYFTKQKFH